MPDAYTLATLDRFVGRELGVSDWVEVDQARIDAFAACTGDRQWIHVDPARAAESPLGTTIAHGLLTLSLIPQMNQQVGVVPADAGHVLNYGSDRVRYLAPVRAGRRVRGRIVLLSAEDRGAGRVLLKTRVTVEIEGEETPALVAENLVLAFPA